MVYGIWISSKTSQRFNIMAVFLSPWRSHAPSEFLRFFSSHSPNTHRSHESDTLCF